MMKLLDEESVRLQRIVDVDVENMGIDEIGRHLDELEAGIKRHSHLMATATDGVGWCQVLLYRRLGELLAIAEVQP